MSPSALLSPKSAKNDDMDAAAVEVRQCGPVALLLRSESVTPAALADWMRTTFGEKLQEAVPGATTVMAIWRTRSDCTRAAEDLVAYTGPIQPRSMTLRDPLELPVFFDGPDLEEVANLARCTVPEVIATMTSVVLEVSFCGFAPGFGYLRGLPEHLHLPRRSSPRPRVEAGSVAIAAGYAAIYPSASPGGWHIIGHCDVPMWNLANDPPSLMTPGRVIRFVDHGHQDRMGRQ
jgi:KipI family sensor histidine kinase inhibitor